MVKKVELRKGLYYDSVKLMLVSKAIADVEGVSKASVVMGTELNKENLSRQGMDSEESRQAGASDLIISLEAETDEALERAVEEMERQLAHNAESQEGACYRPRTFESALKLQPGTNIAIVSVPGAHAVPVARDALAAGLHLMLFSDNVSLEDERALKEEAAERGLLVMGPDCGTAVINGVPLCFANVVSEGSVGMVSASGTGSQEVMALLDAYGVGITQNIGTGGRDLKEAVGGLTFLQALATLNEDDDTKMIVLISKPPSEAITDKILAYVRERVTKPVVLNLIGAEPREGVGEHVHFARSLEECALVAAGLAKGEAVVPFWGAATLEDKAQGLARAIGRPDGFVRAYYSGGTLAYEAELLFKQHGGAVVTNLSGVRGVDPVDQAAQVVIDFGEDEYTVGRAHPMIDSTLRAEAFERALNDEKTSIVLLDFVLGYGASARPHEDFVKLLHSSDGRVPVVANVIGTEADPQCLSSVIAELEEAGILVAPSNKMAIDVVCRAMEIKER